MSRVNLPQPGLPEHYIKTYVERYIVLLDSLCLIPKSGGVLTNSATRRVEPDYPPLARAARISGSVVVEVTLDEDGGVISARAISGHPLLKDAAVNAARRWQFSPTMLSGVPVKVIGTLNFNFEP